MTWLECVHLWIHTRTFLGSLQTCPMLQCPLPCAASRVQSSVGFHDVLSLCCLGWSWEHRDRVNWGNNHANSADGSWQEGSDHVAPSMMEGLPSGLPWPCRRLPPCWSLFLESVRSRGGDALLFLLFLFSLIILLKSSALSQEMFH